MKSQPPSHRKCQPVGVRCMRLLALYFLLNSLGCVFAGNACVGGEVSNPKHDRNVSIGRIEMNVSLPSSFDQIRLDRVHVSPYLQSSFNSGLPHFCVESSLPTNLGENRCNQCSSGSTGKTGDDDGNKMLHILVISVVLGGLSGVVGCPIGLWVARYFLANVL